MFATPIRSPVPWFRRTCLVTTSRDGLAPLVVEFFRVTQWAAVRIRFGAITEPPQKLPPVDAERSDAMNGHVPSGATVPLMMRACAGGASTAGFSGAACAAAGAMASARAVAVAILR